VRAGLAIIIVCTGVLVATVLGWLPADGGVWGSVFMLVGIVLLLPLGLQPLSRVAALALHNWMPVESRLACRQLLRHQSRTTLTVGVIFIAVSTGIGLANSVIDNVQDVRDWARNTIIADFFVRAMAPDTATGKTADMPDALDTKIDAVPGIKAIDRVYSVVTSVNGEQVLMIIRRFDNPELQEFELMGGDKDTIRQSLRTGDVVIGSVFAQRANIKVDDKVKLGTENKEFRVAGITNDYQAGGLTLYIDSTVAKRELNISGVNAYVINAEPGRHREVEQALEELTSRYGVKLQSYHDIARKIDRMMAGVVAALWGMVVLGLVVAAFGVTNTLMMTVLEQTREFGLLRVIAMNRWQLRKTILAQALVMGLLALVPGIFAGVAVAYLIHLATMPITGHPVQFVPHPWLLISGFVAGLIVILIAAWIPAERASRLQLSDAMRVG
jgi:putative ABC transport system permease protein